MSYINFTFTQNFTGTFAAETAELRVGFSREGARLENVERLEHDGSYTTVAVSPEIASAADGVRDAITGAGWLASVSVDRRVPGAEPVNVSWGERHGGSGVAATAADAPANVQQAIEAATLLAELSHNAPAAKPFSPGG